MPMSVASRKGISAVSALAEDQRVILTSHGRAVAVVDSARRIDADLQQMREAALAVADAAADLVRGRSRMRSLDAVCEHLGVDVDALRQRVEARRTADP